jgi:hypothetical protein
MGFRKLIRLARKPRADGAFIDHASPLGIRLRAAHERQRAAMKRDGLDAWFNASVSQAGAIRNHWRCNWALKLPRHG